MRWRTKEKTEQPCSSQPLALVLASIAAHRSLGIWVKGPLRSQTHKGAPGCGFFKWCPSGHHRAEPASCFSLGKPRKRAREGARASWASLSDPDQALLLGGPEGFWALTVVQLGASCFTWICQEIPHASPHGRCHNYPVLAEKETKAQRGKVPAGNSLW